MNLLPRSFILPIMMTFFAFATSVKVARADSKVFPDSGEAVSESIDLTYPGTLPFRVARFYGSRSNFKGVLGRGWSFDFESRLRVAADGSVVIQEGGGGHRNRFVPLTGRGSDPAKVVEDLVAAYRRTGVINGAAAIEDYRARLRTDPDFRDSEAEKFTRQKFMRPVVIARGAQLISERFGYEYVSRVEDGWMRRRSDALWERFDEQGRLRKINDDRGNFLEYAYDDHGLMTTIRDRLERAVYFAYDTSGRLQKITGLYQQKVEYKYDKFGELATVRSGEGSDLDYKYDENRRGLLLEVHYGYGLFERFTYADAAGAENVKTFRDREGWITTYEYNSPETYTRVTRDGHGDIREAAKVQNTWALHANGEHWLSKSVVTVGDEVTETTYNECCQEPVRVQLGGQQQLYEYDSRARLVRKTSPDQTEEWAYDPKSNQLARHLVTSTTGAPARETTYFYDAGGELLSVSTGPAEKFGFLVDPLGRIKSLTDPKGRKFVIQYAAGSVPVELADNAGRRVHVIYAQAMRPFSLQIENMEVMPMITDLTEDLDRLKEILPPGKFNYPEILEQLRDLKSALIMTKKASR